MSLALSIAAVAWASASGLPALLLRGSPRAAQRLSCAALCLASAMGIAAGVLGMVGPATTLTAGWPVPYGSFALRLDGLAGFFLLPVFAIPALVAVYGLGYWPQDRLGARAARLQVFLGLVTGSMALVVLAANGMLFLVAWEVMSVAAFLLVLTEHEKADAQRAAFLYLAAAHAGTFALLALFCLEARATGSFDFARWQGLPAAGARGAVCFSLALAGFGLKAGLMPLHFWLPPAHAAAPSHVSALLSGVLLKASIYGLLRITGLFEAPPASWGIALLALGTFSAVLGVAFALAQHDLKRLLAYHSVENIGIIAMGMGLALLGRARGDAALVLLGFAGALLHVVNHSLFKSLLFLGAGSVVHACGTRDIDRLGGLARAMPWTASLFLVGAAAISGLPPLNGFVSEWLVGLGALKALGRPPGDPVAFAALALPALALVGGLAAACFVKVHGVVFLGNPRGAEARGAHESPATMLVPMAVLAAACGAIGLFPGVLVPALSRAAAGWAGLPEAALLGPTRDAAQAAARVSWMAAALVAAAAAVVLLRRRLLPAPQPRGETWGCGYAAPTARMQYTASSFAAGLVPHFSWAIFPRVHVAFPRGLFPGKSRFHGDVPDTVLDLGILPAVRRVERAARWLKTLLTVSRVQFHALLLLATLVLILAWSLVSR